MELHKCIDLIQYILCISRLVQRPANELVGILFFMKSSNDYFTEYYRLLIPCVNALRREVFPHGRR